MEGETEEAAVPFEPGKGKPPGANLKGAGQNQYANDFIFTFAFNLGLHFHRSDSKYFNNKIDH